MDAPPRLEADQQALVDALRPVRAFLERLAAGDAGTRRKPRAKPRAGTAADAGQPSDRASALGRLAAAFGLSRFEVHVLLLAAGPDLDGSFPELCAASSPARRPFPTFALALAALPGAHWSAVLPESPLRRWHLVELLGDDVATARLRVPERVLHHLAGLPCDADARRLGWSPADVPAALPPGLVQQSLQLARLLSGGTPFVHLVGTDASTRQAVAAAAAFEAGLRLHVARSADLPAAPAERDAAARIAAREIILDGVLLLVEAEDHPDAWRHRVGPFAAAAAVPLLVSGGRGATTPPVPIRFEVQAATLDDRRAMWAAAMADTDGAASDEAGAAAGETAAAVLADQFRLPPADVQAATRAARAGDPAVTLRDRLWSASRLQARLHLEGLAERIEPRAGWDALILPPDRVATLRAIAAQVRHRAAVLQGWGFGEQRGTGTAALFAGPSGTGKSLAAEVLARDLGLDLWRIDLSRVVDKYIGETEKNLGRIFDAAESGGAVLLFDEADSLFGKRTEVRDAHDRYSNLEVAYLLQRMESYGGVALLTTNLRQNVDPAFLRRLRFVVDFPFPDAAARLRLWSLAIPASIPTDGLDLQRLAGWSLSGGSIRSIALNAAFMAADDGGQLAQRHLDRAAQLEHAKLQIPYAIRPTQEVAA